MASTPADACDTSEWEITQCFGRQGVAGPCGKWLRAGSEICSTLPVVTNSSRCCPRTCGEHAFSSMVRAGEQWLSVQHLAPKRLTDVPCTQATIASSPDKCWLVANSARLLFAPETQHRANYATLTISMCWHVVPGHGTKQSSGSSFPTAVRVCNCHAPRVLPSSVRLRWRQAQIGFANHLVAS